MSEQDINSIALFFFLALLDEKKCVKLSQKVIKELKKSWKNDSSIDKEQSLISECQVVLEKALDGKSNVIGAVVSNGEDWGLPKNVGLEAWKKFLQTEEISNVIPLIWGEVLGKSDENISKALNLSRGTIQTRIAKGLAHLGSHCTSEMVNA